MIYKKYLIQVLVLLLISIGWKCSSSEYATLSFDNISLVNIDSVVFKINNYEYKMEKIPPMSLIKQKVHLDTIKLNNHHIIVIANLYVKDTLFRGAYHYNDLYGGLDKGYKLILNKDSTTKLISTN